MITIVVYLFFVILQWSYWNIYINFMDICSILLNSMAVKSVKFTVYYWQYKPMQQEAF